MRLSHKEFSLNPWESTVFNEQGEASGPITAVYDRFIIIKIAEGVEGVLHANDMTRMEFEALKKMCIRDRFPVINPVEEGLSGFLDGSDE